MPTNERSAPRAEQTASSPAAPAAQFNWESPEARQSLMAMLESVDRLDEFLRRQQQDLEGQLAAHGLDSPEAIAAAMAQVQQSDAEAGPWTAAPAAAAPSSSKSRMNPVQMRSRI